MAINYSCPITGNQRDNTVVRIVAGFTTVIGAFSIYLALNNNLPTATTIIALLAIDFIIRAFFAPKYSLLASIGRGIVSGLKLESNMVDAGPKIFAARIGVIFTLSATVLLSLNLVFAAAVVLIILLVCATLEALLNFCVGCAVYSILPRKVGNALSKEFI